MAKRALPGSKREGYYRGRKEGKRKEDRKD
jgi:hypothetical protein